MAVMATTKMIVKRTRMLMLLVSVFEPAPLTITSRADFDRRSSILQNHQMKGQKCLNGKTGDLRQSTRGLPKNAGILDQGLAI
jgi:hypothetical protein